MIDVVTLGQFSPGLTDRAKRRACLLQDLIPLSSHALLLSGRAGFELVQKAVTAGIECVASIGAPSSLSAQLAEESGLTLAGFVSEAGFNMYSHPRRVLR